MTKTKTIKLTILFIIGVLLTAVLGVSIAMGVSALSTPMQTWGFAYLDSIPVPEGTVIDVYIGDDTTPSGTTNTTVLGTYGSIMIIGDSTQYGDELRYTIDGHPTVKIGPDLGVFGLENQNVSLHGYTNIIPITPTSTHTWTFYNNGFEPKHLPDFFTSTVNLSTVDNMPIEIQGVYKFDDITSTWLFWCDGAPGCTLDVLEGGLTADYMIAHYGACEWEIPLE